MPEWGTPISFYQRVTRSSRIVGLSGRDTLDSIAITMADPTLQTFCCHHTNRTDRAITIMQEFNTDAYNTVCMLSSTMGMIGAIYQVIDINTEYSFSPNELSLSAICFFSN